MNVINCPEQVAMISKTVSGGSLEHRSIPDDLVYGTTSIGPTTCTFCNADKSSTLLVERNFRSQNDKYRKLSNLGRCTSACVRLATGLNSFPDTDKLHTVPYPTVKVTPEFTEHI
jgi:hypothetical protein